MKKTLRVLVLLAAVIIISGLSAVTAKAEDVSVLNSSLYSKINSLRTSQGVAALESDASLTSVAAVRSSEASVLWSHTRPNGTQGVQMLPSDEWRGENLSYVIYSSFGFSEAEQQAAADVMYGNLAASPEHYSNMVFTSFTKIGISTTVTYTSQGVKLTTAYMFSN